LRIGRRRSGCLDNDLSAGPSLCHPPALGGEVLATVTLDRGAFACALSRRHDPRLFVVGQIFGGPEPAQPSGQVVVVPGAPGREPGSPDQWIRRQPRSDRQEPRPRRHLVNP